MRGKPPSFSDDENRVLRAALRELQKQRGISGAALGRLLGTSQSAMSQLLGYERRGLSRSTANKLARELKFRDAEALLLDRDVLAAMKEIPSGRAWGNRDMAIRIAQRLGYEQNAIEAIIARYTDASARTRPSKWWITKFGEEERELAVDRAEASAHPMLPPARALPALPAAPRKRGPRG